MRLGFCHRINICTLKHCTIGEYAFRILPLQAWRLCVRDALKLGFIDGRAGCSIFHVAKDSRAPPSTNRASSWSGRRLAWAESARIASDRCVPWARSIVQIGNNQDFSCLHHSMHAVRRFSCVAQSPTDSVVGLLCTAHCNSHVFNSYSKLISK